MKVLIVGGGGREHALAWRVAASARVSEVLVAPGNAGTAMEPRTRNVDVQAMDIDGLIALAAREAVGLTIVGPDAAVAAGIRDAFDAAGLKCLAPTRAAAQLESSKSFAKAFMARHGIPTARYASFDDVVAAENYIRAQGAPIVVKADGLAAGKGVIVAATVDEAVAAVRGMLSGDAFGAAGRRVVIEAALVGEEASFIVLVDGRTAVPFATSQDYKRIFDGDCGPNTGGMGACSPAPVVTAAVHARVMAEVIQPTVAGMAAEGMPFQGFLYAGLMIAPDGTPNVIEFNCRFGDPEAQPVLLRMRSDLVEACEAALAGQLAGSTLQFDPRPALAVVMAAAGYPGEYRRGARIMGLPRDAGASRGAADDATVTAVTSARESAAAQVNAAPVHGVQVKVFHAGTRRMADGSLVTDGGRVLCVVGAADTLPDAQRSAYRAVANISFEGAQYRRDIGHRAIARDTRVG